MVYLKESLDFATVLHLESVYLFLLLITEIMELTELLLLEYIDLSLAFLLKIPNVGLMFGSQFLELGNVCAGRRGANVMGLGLPCRGSS